VQGIDVGVDLVAQPLLPLDARRDAGRTAGRADHAEVVLEVEPEVHVGLIARAGQRRREERVDLALDRRQGLGRAQLLQGALDARAGLGERGQIELPLVAETDGEARQRRDVAVRLEILEEILFVGDDHAARRIRQRLRRSHEARRQRLQAVPAVAEAADHVERIARLETIARRLRRHEVDRGERVEGFGVATDALAAAELRVPLHQDLGAIETRRQVDLVLAVPGVGHERVAAADPLPRPQGAAAAPQRSEAERMGLVLHRVRQREAHAVAPLDAARVIHPAQDRLSRRRSQRHSKGVERHADVARADLVDQVVELRRRAVAFIGPHPQAAIAVPATLRVGWIGGRRVGQRQVVVERIEEDLAVRRLVGEPDVIGVVVGRDVDALLLRSRARWRERERETEREGYDRALEHAVGLERRRNGTIARPTRHRCTLQFTTARAIRPRFRRSKSLKFVARSRGRPRVAAVDAG
jgi:hypothetical protein